MKKKTIGIVGWKTSENTFGATSNYLEFARRFGNPRILMPEEEFVEVDLLILPGGADTAPSNYGENPSYHVSNHDVMKEHFFRTKLQNYIEAKTPILGICLGMQMLNVYFGGSLVQDLLFHKQSSDRWATAHKVQLSLGDKKKSFEVNSHHHQCVTPKTLGADLTALAYAENEDENVVSDEKHIVEAFMHNYLPILGVQWHPKFFGAC